ncbi:hypothetical protein FJZ36_13490 [Candidatus Poribacteria bacterium]|nr:hypothetical protein [Candidatus Poribacteria bacterium]
MPWRTIAKRAVVAIACLTRLPFAATAQPTEGSTISGFRHEETLTAITELEFHAFERSFVVGDSIEVVADEVVLPAGIAYRFDALRNRIRFTPPLHIGTVVEVSYESLALGIDPRSSLDLFAVDPALTRLRVPARVPEPGFGAAQPQAGVLDVSGSKTFAISAGSNRSFAPDQSLRLNVDGEIVPGISVSAALTDQQLPIQPEGTTEELDRLDDVLIRVTAERFAVSLGDDEVHLADTDLILAPMRVQGVQVRGNGGPGEGQLVAALPRGKSDSVTIVGTEGQNSYRVSPRGRFVVMVAGSEQVWLNGTPMVRGASNDYVIRDYGDPVVEFTLKRLITRNDIIRIDYEYRDDLEGWQRNLYAGRAGLSSPDGKNRLGFAYATESDDQRRPLGVLTDSDWQRLREGETTSEDGRSLTAPIRRRVVGFDSSVSLGERTSVRADWAHHQADRNTLHEGDDGRGGVAWRVGAQSRLNRLSFDATAERSQASFQTVGTSGSLRSSYAARASEESYGDALLGVGLARAVGISPQTQERYAASAEWTPARGMGAKASGSWSEDDHAGDDPDERALNWSGQLRMDRPSLPKAIYTRRRSLVERGVDDDFTKDETTWAFEDRIGPLQATYTRERFAAADDTVSDGANRNLRRSRDAYRLAGVSSTRATASARWENERTEGRDPILAEQDVVIGFGDWRTTSEAQTLGIDSSVRPNDWLDFIGTLARRTFRQLGSDGSDLNAILADLQASATPWRRAVDVSARMRLDRRLSSRREEVYTNVILDDGVPVRIQPGQGMYVRIDDYHYDEDPERGDYIRIVRTVGDTPVTTGEGQIRVRLDPGSATLGRRKAEGTTASTPRALSALAGVSFDSTLDMSEEHENASALDIVPWHDMNRASTVYGVRRHDVRVRWAPAPAFSADAERRLNRTVNRRLNSEDRSIRTESMRYRLRAAPWRRLTFEGTTDRMLSTERIEHVDAEDLVNSRLVSDLWRDEREHAITTRFSLTPAWFVGIRGALETEKALESAGETEAAETRTRAAEALLNWLLPSKGRAEATFRLAHGSSVGAQLPLTRYRFYDGLSQEIRLRADYRAQSFTDLTFRLNYHMISARRQPTEHRLDLELVAEL